MKILLKVKKSIPVFKFYSIFTVNHGCGKKLEPGQICPFICVGSFSVFMFSLQSAPGEGTIHLCLLYHSHGGKKQCSYCVIGRHKSWGCEPANPVTHHNGCYVWQRNSQKRALCYTWDLWQRGDIYNPSTLQRYRNIYLVLILMRIAGKSLRPFKI